MTNRQGSARFMGEIDGQRPQRAGERVTERSADQVRLLRAVAAIAGAAFLAEIVAGALTGSQALAADALDFGALASTLLLGLWSAHQPPAMRLRVELGRHVVWTAAGVWLALTTLHRFLTHPVPEAEFMGAVGLLALMANAAILSLLDDAASVDPEFRAVRHAARNDMIGNLSVILAAGLVAIMGTAAADLVVAGVLVAVFLTGSIPALRRSWHAFEAARPARAQQETRQ